jgi:hypothetical protein
MTAPKARIEALIDALNPVLANDPPARWRPACEELRRELDRAATIDHSLRVVGPALAVVAFLTLEGHRLTVAALAPLPLIGVCVLAAAFASDARARMSAMTALVPLVLWLVSLVTDINGYVLLAMGINLTIGYLLERIYPALELRERITFMLDYFGFKPQSANAVA